MAHTRETLTEKLASLGAVPIWTDNRQNFGNKVKIAFRCPCGAEAEKAIRDIDRCGAFCKACQKSNKSALVSQARSMPPQIVTNPETEQICSECHWVKPKDEFVHAQNHNLSSVRCATCRTKTQKKDARARDRGKKRQVPEDKSDTHQKCTKCFRVKPKTQFTLGNGNCIPCNTNSRTGYKKVKAKAEEHNSNPATETVMCVRCWCVDETAQFTTDEGHVGVVCGNCREQIAIHRSSYNEAYVALKKARGACVDCGEADIRVLEFDHVDRETKEMLVSDYKSVGDLLSEAPKCDIRCGICHVRRTSEQLNYGNPQNKGNEWLARRAIATERKLRTGCEECGWVDADLPEALHFDHLDASEKVAGIAEHMAFETMEAFLAEIETCQVLCINCHKRRTLDQIDSKLYE